MLVCQHITFFGKFKIYSFFVSLRWSRGGFIKFLNSLSQWDKFYGWNLKLTTLFLKLFYLKIVLDCPVVLFVPIPILQFDVRSCSQFSVKCRF